MKVRELIEALEELDPNAFITSVYAGYITEYRSPVVGEDDTIFVAEQGDGVYKDVTHSERPMGDIKAYVIR